LHISGSGYLLFFAVAAFESKIGMAMFVQLLGDEATWRNILRTEAQDAGRIAQTGGRNMKQKWHGQSAFRIEAGEAKILIDLYLFDNPSRDNGWRGCLTGKRLTQGGNR
jgi:hypothetical protein